MLATNHNTIARAVSTSMRRMGIQVKTKAVHLGVPFRLGGKTRSPPPSATLLSAPRVPAPSAISIKGPMRIGRSTTLISSCGARDVKTAEKSDTS